MKLVYCDQCREVSIRSKLEKDRCNRCGLDARRVPYRRPWQYYASSGILLAVAAVLIAFPMPSLADRFAVLFVGLAIAVGLSVWSLRSLRERVRKAAEAAREAGP